MANTFKTECRHLFNGLTGNNLNTCNSDFCIDMAINHVMINCNLRTLPMSLAWAVVRVAIINWITTNILNQLPLEVDTTIEENATNASNLSILSSIIEGDVTYQFDNSLAKNSQITLKTYRDIANSIITTYQAYVDVELERHRKLRW